METQDEGTYQYEDKRHLQLIVKHVFLPPGIEGGKDPSGYEATLVKKVLGALRNFEVALDDEDASEVIEAAISAITNYKYACPDGHYPTKEGLEATLSILADKSKGSILPVVIAQQNAGLIIRTDKMGVSFDAFELHPLNEAVIKTQGRLRRQFPGSSAIIPIDTFRQNDFQVMLRDTLFKMATQDVAESKARPSPTHPERNTDSPKVVTCLLMSFLRAHGSNSAPGFISKNTREEVFWSGKVAEAPWRRSRVWLMLRVMLHLTFARLSAPRWQGDGLFKRFMVFFMAELLPEALKHNLDTETMFSMNAKIARRHRKLDVPQHEPWVKTVLQRVKTASETMEHRWTTIQNIDLCDTTEPVEVARLSKTDDFVHQCTELDTFLVSARQKHANEAKKEFEPTGGFMALTPRLFPPKSDYLSGDPTYAVMRLISMEENIVDNLKDWLKSRLDKENTCSTLLATMKNYHECACSAYSRQPEGVSSMILTCLELWIACDQAAVNQFPVLKHHSPEVPMDIWAVLVLRTKRDKQRLEQAESYIRTRLATARRPGVLSTDFGDKKSIQVAYATKDEGMQASVSSIKKQVKEERKQITKELEESKVRHDSLLKRAHNQWCNAQYGVRSDKHMKSCERCRLLSEADQMSIRVHEDFLPEDQDHQLAIAFELNPPLVFKEWREMTVYLISAVLGYESAPPETSQKPCPLIKYKGLADHVQYSRTTVVTVASQSSARHGAQIPVSSATPDKICVPHGGKWGLYDLFGSQFVKGLHRTQSSCSNCIFDLPAESGLQPYVQHEIAGSADSRLPNHVYEDLWKVPEDMGLDEFKALSSMPLGQSIRWANILRELAVPNVDWKRLETTMMIWHCSGQVGPALNDGSREAQRLCSENGLVKKLLSHLKLSLERVKQNWEATHALASFTTLAAQLLIYCQPEDEKGLIAFLASCRESCSRWINLIDKRLESPVGQRTRENLSHKVREVALLLASTFSLDETHMAQLFHNKKEYFLFLHCSMLIRNSDIESQDCAFTRTLTLRWQRASYYQWRQPSCRSIMMSCIPLAIQRHIGKLKMDPHRNWTEVKTHWLASRTIRTDRTTASLHYNMLTGELLMDGIPVGTVPESYSQNAVYRLLFDDELLSVQPSVEGGRFSLSTRQKYSEYVLHLGLQPSTHDPQRENMLVKAVGDQEEMELIPEEVFREVIPHALIDDFVHWYDVGGNTVRFLPKSDPWKRPEAFWYLSRESDGWVLRHTDGSSSICPSSQLGSYLSEVFKPLQEPLGLHICRKSPTSAVTVNLPKFRLTFHTKEGSPNLFSDQYPRMYVDPVQNIGSLVGLINKLVLRHEIHASKRLALIPDGSVSAAEQQAGQATQHVLVTIEQCTQIHVYNVNHMLGSLESNGSLQSKLFLALLHGSTSYPLPDPLTQQTGTERAVEILRSGSVRSFEQLSKTNCDTLRQIAQLVPRRTYHPGKSRLGQLVSWEDTEVALGTYAKDGALFIAVQRIFHKAAELSFLYPLAYSDELLALHKPSETLLRRDMLRQTTFRTLDRASDDWETSITDEDQEYAARDTHAGCSKCHDVQSTCLSLLDSAPKLYIKVPESLPDSVISAFGVTDKIEGFLCPLSLNKIQYDAGWLRPPSELFPGFFFRLYTKIQQDLSTLNPYNIRIILCSLAYQANPDEGIVALLIGLVRFERVRKVPLPECESFSVGQGWTFDFESIKALAQKHFLKDSPPKAGKQTRGAKKPRGGQAKKLKQQHAIREFATHVQGFWPDSEPVAEGIDEVCTDYIDVNAAINATRLRFRDWQQNRQLTEWLHLVSNIIQQADREEGPTYDFQVGSPLHKVTPLNRDISLQHLMSQIPPPSLKLGGGEDIMQKCLSPNPHETHSLLSTHLGKLRERTHSEFQDRYLDELQKSSTSLLEMPSGYKLTVSLAELEPVLTVNHDEAKDRVSRNLEMLSETLRGGHEYSGTYSVSTAAHTWPHHSIRFFLQCLSHQRVELLNGAWRNCLLSFAESVEHMQWAERLVAASSEPELIKELTTQRSSTWDIAAHPDTILLEIEQNLRVRAAQSEIAQVMAYPPSGKSSVFQLNMGQGKSSVILPIVAAALGDGNRLVRVIVGKSQSRQACEILVSRVGELIDRQVYYLPFSRNTTIDRNQIESLVKMFQECQHTGGIVIAQPEHLLSLQLMTLEFFTKGQFELGNGLLLLRGLFTDFARDLVDECDDIFSPRFELTYSCGQQSAPDFCPARWNICQEVLTLCATVAPVVYERLPGSLEFVPNQAGRFPSLLRLLDYESRDELVQTIAKCICFDSELPSLPTTRLTDDLKNALYLYLTVKSPCGDTIKIVECSPLWKTSNRNVVLLVRGLLEGGVLAFALAKRWRVNYGVDSSRQPETNLAVPFRAKDSPSTRSEYTHPDVVILLTSLSYYYKGLSDQELSRTLSHLGKTQARACEQYASWGKQASMAGKYCKLSNVNLRDEAHCQEEIFPSLRHSKAAIDYFLSYLIFPKHGTNDSRDLLPLGISHVELESQQHTNALVLNNLLHPDNDFEMAPKAAEGCGSYGRAFIDFINAKKPEIRVILDVGALILDLTNAEVAQQWLQATSNRDDVQREDVKRDDVEAVVYCDDRDELMVMDRAGATERLQTSPFSKKLDKCCVFLDEAHTRGIDLRLPSTYRAAVTLGSSVTKDKLVQACMRMRKLGSGQNLTFCVPEAILPSICASRLTEPSATIDIADIISWSISETCSELKKGVALWAGQGERFHAQNPLWQCTSTVYVQSTDLPNGPALPEKTMSKDTAAKFILPDAESIESKYGLAHSQSHDQEEDVEMDGPLAIIRQRCAEFETSGDTSGDLNDEQERELQPETEHESFIERPPAIFCHTNELDEDLVTYVRTGEMGEFASAFISAFGESLRDTSAAEDFDTSEFPEGLMVTRDFSRTIDPLMPGDTLDVYQREVRWVLVSRDEEKVTSMVVISPFEADKLMEEIRQSERVTLHAYSPKQVQGYNPVDDLQLLSVPHFPDNVEIPQKLIIELNLFAGQLYFSSFAEYKAVCRWLNVASGPATEGMVVRPDGFIERSDEMSDEEPSSFTESPMEFIRILMTRIRRPMDAIGKTHMGMLLDGKLLTKKELK